MTPSNLIRRYMAGAMIGSAMSCLIVSSSGAATATVESFGKLPNGQEVTAITLTNRHGLKARILTLGAMWQQMLVPDRHGKLDDVVLGYDSLKDYVARNQFMGVTVGRYANRIRAGRFSIDGKAYQLTINNGPNALHGGPAGFWSHNWTLESVSKGGKHNPASVTLKYVSPDGEEGYPGTMTVHVTYSLNDQDDLSIAYAATTDTPTIINLTNHALFNLAGVHSGRSALEASAQVEAETYLPTDDTAIPTGESRAVKGTPFDFTRPRIINAVVRDARDPQILVGLGIDHNFNIRGGVTKTPKMAVRFEDSASGRGLTIRTTEPGIQFYTGNFLDAKTPGKGGLVTRMGDGVAFESQHYPDSPNHPDFPSTRLNPGQTYTQLTIHHFYTQK